MAALISWEQWMARALYEPGRGYYAHHIREVGRRGDFSTSATLGDGLGRALARWIRQRSGDLGWRGRIPVIEVGPGTGELARGIWRASSFLQRLRLDFHLVDTSAPLREMQQRTLRGCRVAWHEDMAGALKATGGRALIYSNELADAFPCRCFVRHPAAWKELAVADGPAVEEAFLEVPEGDLASLNSTGFSMLPRLRDGQRIEVHAAWRNWLETWGGAWTGGRMVTIDYGYRAVPPPRLPLSGTLRAYFRQMRLEGGEIYRRAGQQDLTADVNFTDLQKWGEARGWHTESLLTQAEWLRMWDPSGGGRLADGCDAGGEFLVLEQAA